MGSAPDERPMPVAPPLRGERGSADWCIRLIEAGHCTCDGCGGHLVGVYEEARCSAADAHQAE